MELVDGEDLSERICSRSDPHRRGRLHRAADRRGARGGARAGHRPPRSQAGQHQAETRWNGQGPRLRARQGVGDRDRRLESLALADHDPARHRGRAHPRDRRLHVARTGGRDRGGPTGRHLGLRSRAVGDAHRSQALRRRDHLPCAGVGAQGRGRARRAPGVHPAENSRADRRCLQRKPRQRLQAIGDARIVLEDYERDPEAFSCFGAGRRTRAVGSRSFEDRRPVGDCRRHDGPLSRARLAGDPAARRARACFGRRSLRPRKRCFGFRRLHPVRHRSLRTVPRSCSEPSTAEGNRLLWIRRIKDSVARPLPGTDGAAYPFWAPDSRQVGFFSVDGKLRKIDTSGGPPVTICVAGNGKGGAWNDNDEILFAPTHDSSIHLVSAGGGESVHGDRDLPGHHEPQASNVASGRTVSLSRTFRGRPRRRPGHGGVDRRPGPGPRAPCSGVEHGGRG